MGIKLGDNNKEVEKVTNYLVSKGYLDKSTTVYDAMVAKAIRQLRRDVGAEDSSEWDDNLVKLKASQDNYKETMDKRIKSIIVSSGNSNPLEDVLSTLSNGVYKTKDIKNLKLSNDVTISDHPFKDRELTWNKFIDSCIKSGASLDDIIKCVRANAGNKLTLNEFAQVLTKRVDPKDKDESKGKQVVSPNKPNSHSMRNSIKYAPISCYIVNLRTNTKIEFGLESPPTLSDSKSANFSQQTPLSRSGPFYGYENSSVRDISFDIELQADYCAEDIKTVVNKLRALVYPYVKGCLVYEPKCLIRIGEMFVDIVCICNSVTVSWEKPYKDSTYHKASIGLSFSEIEEHSKSQELVENGG